MLKLANTPVFAVGEITADQQLEGGQIGRTYTISGESEQTNLRMVRRLCALLDELLPDSPYRPHEGLINFVEDRPGHDKRYALDSSVMRQEFG